MRAHPYFVRQRELKITLKRFETVTRDRTYVTDEAKFGRQMSS